MRRYRVSLAPECVVNKKESPPRWAFGGWGCCMSSDVGSVGVEPLDLENSIQGIIEAIEPLLDIPGHTVSPL